MHDAGELQTRPPGHRGPAVDSAAWFAFERFWVTPAPGPSPTPASVRFLVGSPSFCELHLPQAPLGSLQNERPRSVSVLTCRVRRSQKWWLVPAVLGQVCSLACGRERQHRPLPSATWMSPCKDVFHRRKVTRVAVGLVMRPAPWGFGPHSVGSPASSESTRVASLAISRFLGPLCGSHTTRDHRKIILP